MKRAEEVDSQYDFQYFTGLLQLWICGTRWPNKVQILGIQKACNGPAFSQKYDIIWEHAYLLCGVIFCVDENSPFRHIIKGRTHPVSPKDPLVLRKISQWLEETTGQSRCVPSSDKLPSRLLHIKDEGARLSVIATSNQTVNYVALSHCWGSVQRMTLTKDSFDLLKEGVETSSLPQSFQDAIWLTHRLGIQYLWIDSLCILQDSLQDWVHESARMRDVYENAWVTIAASKASCSVEGFLGNQERHEHVSIPYQRGILSGEVVASNIPIDYVGRNCTNLTQRVYLDEEPLTTRGWALQERFISRRTLHFSQSQVMFEHDGLVFTQDNCDPVPIDSYNPMRSTTRHDWYSVVQQFSARDLTKESDKLPALGGLAAYFAVRLLNGKDSEYLAGLWREDMVSGFCWTLCTLYVQTPLGARPKSYHAPSWSWAAIDCKIEHWGNGISGHELAIVEDARTNLVSLESPFGEVQGEPYYRPARGETTDVAKGETDLRFIPMGYDYVEVGQPETIVRVFYLVVKQVKHEVAQHPDLKGFQRVGAGFAGPVPPSGDDDLERLVTGKWMKMKHTDQLEGIILI
ncbi:heterokaryon incompatibility protein-domain-containing protein [Apiospora hydei]|uniref:Heterokaryon incompatibility protein-domain-containing protein n=1 Tax=Apiospora hydei TaxID=1337664 RepID=A0ABR1UQL3_9PEZI